MKWDKIEVIYKTNAVGGFNNDNLQTQHGNATKIGFKGMEWGEGVK